MPLLRALAITFALLLALLWGASYARPFVLRASRTPQEAWFLDASHGRLRLTHQRVTPAAVMGWTADARTLHTITLRDAAGAVVRRSRDDLHRDAKSPWWFDENAGNHLLSLTRTPAGTVNLTMRFACAPIWSGIVLALAPLLIARLRAARLRRQRARRGLCLACGYDLRGTPARCPECGAVPALGSAATA